jgi:hypothetical protein
MLVKRNNTSDQRTPLAVQLDNPFLQSPETMDSQGTTLAGSFYHGNHSGNQPVFRSCGLLF